MGVVQRNAGISNTGGAVTVTLGAATSASNLVVVCIGGDTTVTTPTGWNLRTSQVNFMGHYLWDKAGDGTSSWSFTAAAGALTWEVWEILSGVYDIANSTNDITGQSTYVTPTITPAAGVKSIMASLGSTATSGARTISGWTNSFVEVSDQAAVASDNPMMGVAQLDVTSPGATGYSTTATYSSTSTGRSAVIGAYTTTAGAAPVVRPQRPRVVRQAVNRAGSF